MRWPEVGLFSSSKKHSDDEFRQARLRMVESQLAGRDVSDEAVLEAMRKVPRHLFVGVDLLSEAYDDCPLPIGHGQTISQPYVVASMTEHLRPSRRKRVLEIGTGSGYQAAVLAELFGEVETVEYVPELSRRAQKLLNTLGYTNITFHIGDGLKIPDSGPVFDAIIATAAPERFPKSLPDRLRRGGRLIIPVGEQMQYLHLITKDMAGEVHSQILYAVRFVRLHGGE